MARTDWDLDPVAPSIDGAVKGLGDLLADIQADIAGSLCVPLRLLTGSLGPVVDEMDAYVRTVSRMQKAMTRDMHGAKAPIRKRKKRLAKKLAKRGGYLHHASLGARLGLALSFCVEVSP